MKEKRSDTNTDEIIRNAAKLTDEPAPELNRSLKASLYQREAMIQEDLFLQETMTKNELHLQAGALPKEPALHTLSLWYLPMLLNLAVFLMLGASALMAVSNPYLSCFAAGICFYFGLAGILLTVLGIKRTNMKEEITIRIRKRDA